MEELFVPYKESLELKELECNIACISSYTSNGMLKFFDHWESNSDIPLDVAYKNICTAPLYHQAFKWFREKYKLDSQVIAEGFNKRMYTYEINTLENTSIYGELWLTYEEAELACLRKLIERVKNK